VWAGLVTSAMFNLPPSFPIVSISFAGWLVALAMTRPSRRHAPASVPPSAHAHDHPDEPTSLSL